MGDEEDEEARDKDKDQEISMAIINETNLI
jgi:hypothetical protein